MSDADPLYTNCHLCEAGYAGATYCSSLWEGWARRRQGNLYYSSGASHVSAEVEICDSVCLCSTEQRASLPIGDECDRLAWNRSPSQKPILVLPKKNSVPGTETSESTKSAKVNLVGAVSIPTQKGHVVRARVSSAETVFSYHGVLFEPHHKVLDPLGINVTESLVSLKNGEIVLPVENHQGNVYKVVWSWQIHVGPRAF